ncbi:TPA: relaxase domain-containing protein, partial [Escherichia coli]|nr:relaxase domain-containing protein [Escherichia coli]
VRKDGFIEAVYANQLALGQIQLNLLRRQVEAMGYETVDTGKNGLWEIKGVPVDIFSTRSQQIREAVGDDASAKSRSVAALDTRRAKQKEPDREELLTEWHERIDRTGFSYQALREKAAEREALQQSRSVSEQEKAVLSGEAGGYSQRETSSSSTSGQREGATVPSVMRDAVSQAISLLSDRRAQFTYSDVLSRT